MVILAFSSFCHIPGELILAFKKDACYILQNCNKDDPPCPCVHVERLCFEMDKKYTNTKLQLLLSPCVVIARDSLPVMHDTVEGAC